jgi:hypothetical protein
VGGFVIVNSRIANLVKGRARASRGAKGALDKLTSDSAKLELGLEEKCSLFQKRALGESARSAGLHSPRKQGTFSFQP